jgi:sugar phosphate isomerase/epimerase
VQVSLEVFKRVNIMDNLRNEGLNNTISRRQILRGMGIVSLGAAAGIAGIGCRKPAGAVAPQPASALRGRINHSLVSWPYQVFGEKWDLGTTCRMARELGCTSVELVDPDGWPTLAKYGLNCAIAPNGMPGEPYVKGLNNTNHHKEVIGRTRNVIEAAARAPIKVSSVIAFTGFKYRDAEDPSGDVIPPEEGAKNTVAGLKELALLAERHGVDIYMEHLNSRVPDDTFRGHPGYQGDDIDYCADIIRQVGSPRVKLLFDIYHVQIMNGDIISRIREYGTDLIGHIHTAGVPGRTELDGCQELQYTPIMQSLLDIGYKGYVGHEFIPTRDPLTGLREAILVCDV